MAKKAKAIICCRVSMLEQNLPQVDSIKRQLLEMNDFYRGQIGANVLQLLLPQKYWKSKSPITSRKLNLSLNLLNW